MNLNPIFKAILSYDTLDTDLEKIHNLCKNLHETTEGRQFSNRGGWQSHDVNKDESFAYLVNEIENKIACLTDVYSIKDEFKLSIENMWVNINQKYNYNVLHHHADAFLAGSFYVKVPEGSGEIIFRHPSLIPSVINWSNRFHSLTQNNSVNWYLQPTEGQLVLFPSWLEHEVDQNRSDEERISIAFNITIREK